MASAGRRALSERTHQAEDLVEVRVPVPDRPKVLAEITTLAADVVLHSSTKYLGGHSDVMLGAVVCAREDDAKRLLGVRSRTGPQRG